MVLKKLHCGVRYCADKIPPETLISLVTGRCRTQDYLNANLWTTGILVATSRLQQNITSMQ